MNTNNQYEPLRLELNHGGHHFKQVWRNKRCAAYEQRGHYGQLLGYEAILIKLQDAQEVFGRQYPSKEIYPNDEDWGTYGKTCNSIEEAKKAALGLAANQKTPIKTAGKPPKSDLG